jgi:hypothetical protein
LEHGVAVFVAGVSRAVMLGDDLDFGSLLGNVDAAEMEVAGV